MMHISSDIAFSHSLCRPFMLLLACVLSLAVWPPLRAQEKPVGKHIGYNRYGNRLYQVGGQIDVYPRKQLTKLYSGQFPADAFVPWSKTIYDHKFEIDEQKVRTKHFVYRSHEGYDLEMYIDLPASGSDFPVLFHIFGGGWTSGTPERVEVISKYLASLGIAGVRVGHSLSSHPGATIARAFDDINYARQYVFRRAAECRIDTTRYGYVGGSSGAHLSAVSALRDPGTKVLVGFAGVYDYNMFGGDDKPYFAPNTAEFKREISPASMIPVSSPTVFLGHGLGDFLVGYVQSTNFASWLAKQGLEVELHLYSYYSHAFNHPGITDMFPKLMDEVEHFLQIHL